MDPDRQHDWEGHGLVCHACAAAEHAAAKWTESTADIRGGDPAGMHWYSVRKGVNDA